MDRTTADFSQQSGLPSPYPSNFGGDAHSEPSPSTQDHAAASVQAYPPPPKDAATNYPAAATPVSDYAVYPPPTTSSSAYPHTIQPSYNPASSPSTASMAQQNSPSLPQSDGRNHQAQVVNSDSQVPIDPSIAAPSPTYPYAQHSPYAPNPDMAHSYSHPTSNIYAQPRPEWAGYPPHGATPLTPGHPVYGQNPASVPQQRPGHQHKRPRRRYEEIERMYKCGWNGCEKAYGTLNHLNAHVTMQSHGQKRTPEEFKEIRKEWKARKKEEETQRKADEERQRAQAPANGGSDQSHDGASASSYAGSRPPVQLPPIGFQNSQYPAPPSGVSQQPLPEYGATGHMYPNYSPHSPYGQANQNLYNQANGGGPQGH